MKTIKYETKSGHKIEINVSVNYLLDSQGRRKISGEKKVVVDLKINGEDQPIFGTPLQKLSTPIQGCVAKIGKVGLNEERYELLKSMIDEAQDSIKSHNKALESHAAKLDALGTGDINELIAKHS